MTYQVRGCIYEKGHEGPCVDLDGEWWINPPVRVNDRLTVLTVH